MSATGVLSPTMLRAPVNKWLVAVSIAFGSLMATIDSSIVNVAMPNIRGELGASIQEITWISDSTALTGFHRAGRACCAPSFAVTGGLLDQPFGLASATSATSNDGAATSVPASS